MKKVININFQGQVIPIEETAYEMLQQYVASLRTYFAGEEGRDEIINDIESRIAELFGEQLKKGASCITDAEVNRIMDSMGRPEDFAAEEEGAAPKTNGANQSNTSSAGSSKTGGIPPYSPPLGHKRLYRDEQDKILGGVASGLAHYLSVDPAFIRLVFVLLAIFGGSGILVYIVFWIVLPSRSLVTNIRKRLYRDSDDRIIAGVGGGLAKYFDINPAIPRIIFAAPFILAIVASVWNSIFSFFPGIITSFGGFTFIVAYIILWIVLPVARTAAEKLEMRGEKVDLNSIRDTIVGDLSGFKSKAEKAGAEFTESASKFSSDLQDSLKSKQQKMSSEMGALASNNRNGVAEILGVIIKAFVYFIVGIVAFTLLMLAIGLLVGGVAVFPLHDYLLQGTWQHMAAWGTLILFLGVPVIALLVFLIRRIMGVKKTNPYISYAFTTLWIIGLVAMLVLVGSFNRSFRTQVAVREDIPLQQPSTNSLKLMVKYNNDVIVYDSWMDFDGLVSVGEDSMRLNTVKVNVVKSPDGLYHAYLMKMSRGNNNVQAEDLAEKITLEASQNDSILYLAPSFKISRNDKWRNQKMVVVVEVPENKMIELDQSLDDYDYFNIEFNGRRYRRGNFDFERYDNLNFYDKNRKLRMTKDGLERIKKTYQYDNNSGRFEPDTETEDSSIDSIEMRVDSAGTIEDNDIYRYSKTKQETEKQIQLPRGAIIGNPLTMMLRY